MSRIRPLLLLASLAFGATLTPVAGGQTPLRTERIAAGLSSALWLGSPPKDEDRLFVAEQNSGLIKIIRNGAVMPTPFLNIKSKIRTSSERGLLGVAFHPNYEANGYFFVNYTRAGDGATMVERYTVSATNPNVANPASAKLILGPISQPSSNHNGGCLQFSPVDGLLYIATGDGGGSGDPQCRAQNGQELLGKILRIDVDSPGTEYIPPSNPFVGNGAFRNQIWAYGLRNPWRFGFDRLTGDLYIGDVGQNRREEVNFQPASSAGGENYGWKIMEGLLCFSTSNCSNPPQCNAASLVKPVYDYQTGSNCTVIGGYVYRGCAIPDLAGTYFFADYCSARIWSFEYDGQNRTNFQERTAELRPSTGATGRITSFGEDGRGEIYIVARNGIFKIMAGGTPSAVNLGFGTIGGNGEEPLFEVCGLLSVGLSAEFILRRAAATAAASLLLSTSNNPTLFPPIGTLVPLPAQLILPVLTSSEGRVQFTVNGVSGPATAFGQWVVLDPLAPSGLAFSNAVQLNFP